LNRIFRQGNKILKNLGLKLYHLFRKSFKSWLEDFDSSSYEIKQIKSSDSPYLEKNDVDGLILLTVDLIY